MARRPQDITEAELGIMQILWDLQRQTIRALTSALYPSGTSVHYATVQKLLERLEAKGCVRRDRGVWPHEFEPAIIRDELIARRLRATADQLCSGSMAPLLTNLVKTQALSAEDRQSLRDLLDRLDREQS